MKTENLTVVCSICGMKQVDWPNKEGVMENGHLYCCSGCALGSGCTCKK